MTQQFHFKELSLKKSPMIWAKGKYKSILLHKIAKVEKYANCFIRGSWLRKLYSNHMMEYYVTNKNYVISCQKIRTGMAKSLCFQVKEATRVCLI